MSYVDMGDPLAEIGIFAGAADVSEVDARLQNEVTHEVVEMLQLTEGCDAFDVVELMRMRELPLSPGLSLNSGYDGVGAAIEVVALVMLGRGERRPGETERDHTRPHEVIDELHRRAKRLLRLATYRAKSIEQLRGADPLNRMMAEYQSYLVWVRAQQYQSVQTEHERALFTRPEVERLLQTHLGFRYSDLIEVRYAAQRHVSHGMNSIRDSTWDAFQDRQATGAELAPERREEVRRALISLMFLPGDRAAFTAEQVAETGSLETGVVARVLDRFSLDFATADASEVLVMDFLRGRNPLVRRGLLRSEGAHVVVSVPPGADAFRRVVEDAVKTSAKDLERYNKSRRVVTESLAVSALERALGSSAFASGFRYHAPKDGVAVELLGRECDELAAVGKDVESDGLFVIDDVAVCLEVKGRSVADAARRGDVNRLRTELKNILGDGSRQARRLEGLIRANGGVWRSDGTWLDLAHVCEVRTIVAGLDHFGPLSVGLGDLRDAGFVDGNSMPWCVTIHDLDVISRVVDRPAEFLLYLRRRTSSGVAAHFRGADELDLFMLFLNAGLFVEDDPDEVHRMHPKTRPPTDTARKHHLGSSRPTLVATHTDPLDAWMYWCEGSSDVEVDKPSFNHNLAVGHLVNFLADGRKPGWLRTGADLLALSGDAQRRLTNEIKKLVTRTQRDSRPHVISQGFATLDGFPLVFVRTLAVDGDSETEGGALMAYMLAKKHQLGSDRALGFLIDHQGTIVATLYMNGPAAENSELDALGEEMGLKETWVRPKRATSVSKKKQRRRAKRGWREGT